MLRLAINYIKHAPRLAPSDIVLVKSAERPVSSPLELSATADVGETYASLAMPS